MNFFLGSVFFVASKLKIRSDLRTRSSLLFDIHKSLLAVSKKALKSQSITNSRSRYLRTVPWWTCKCEHTNAKNRSEIVLFLIFHFIDFFYLLFFLSRLSLITFTRMFFSQNDSICHVIVSLLTILSLICATHSIHSRTELFLNLCAIGSLLILL